MWEANEYHLTPGRTPERCKGSLSNISGTKQGEALFSMVVMYKNIKAVHLIGTRRSCKSIFHMTRVESQTMSNRKFTDPVCLSPVVASASHTSFCRGEQREITVTSWYLENRRGHGSSLHNFLSFPRRINMLKAMSQNCRAAAGPQNRSSVASRSLIHYRRRGEGLDFKVHA